MNFGEPGYFAEFGYESAGIRGGSGNIQTFTGVTDAAGVTPCASISNPWTRPNLRR